MEVKSNYVGFILYKTNKNGMNLLEGTDLLFYGGLWSARLKKEDTNIGERKYVSAHISDERMWY